MRKVFITYTLCIFITYLGSSQDLIDTSLLMSDIVISQNRIHSQLSESSRNIQVIRKTEIESIPASSIAELLQYFSGVDIKRRGVQGVQADLSIRGGTFNQALVLINGVKMIDPQTGHHTMNIPLSTIDIERIEIIKGPAARIYGANAFSGVINIITKLKTTEEIDVQFPSQLGSFETFENSISVQLPHERIDQSITFSHQSSEGYRHNTDYKVGNIFYQSSIKLNQQSIDITAGYTDRKFGANGFYASAAATEQYEEVRTTFAAMETTIIRDNFSLKPMLSWRNNKDHYVYIRSNPQVYENNHLSNAYNAELHGTYTSNLGSTGLGLEYSYQTLESNNLGDRNRSVMGMYAEHLVSFLDQKLDVTVGFYLNKFSDQNVEVYPGIDLSYALGSETFLFGSFNQANRIPTFTNLFYSSPSEQGNENLTSESITSYEIGIRKLSRSSYLSASIFYNQNDNLIDWTKDSLDQVQWQAVNFNKINTLGLDISAQYNFSSLLRSSRDLKVSIGYTYLHAEVLQNEEINVSRYSLDQLNHHFLAGANMEVTKDLFIDVRYRYLDRVSLDNYDLIDTKLYLRKHNYELSFAINNLLDQEYKETNLVPMPGRWYSVGLKLR